MFAVAIAKYFSNAQREDVLLSRARGGIIYLPGAAGTVQEIFQAVTPNYYGDPATQIPLILVGVDHWTVNLPVWPLLQPSPRNRPMAPSIHLVDTIEEAASPGQLRTPGSVGGVVYGAGHGEFRVGAWGLAWWRGRGTRWLRGCARGAWGSIR